MKKKKKRPVVIIHFQPVELYPPIVNLLKYLDKHQMQVLVLSTRNKKGNTFNESNNLFENIRIKRTAGINAGTPFRVFNYAFFYIYSFYLLVKHRPKAVLYFETISSWPALIYKKWRRNKVNLFVHYHEYVSVDEYAINMRLVKWMHALESKMYDKDFHWISHTNEPRMQKFIIDHQLEKINRSIFHTMANYPSKSWAKGKAACRGSNNIRLVYVGSLGYNTMYLKEIVDWVILHAEELSLDIYSHNMDEKSRHFLQTIEHHQVRFHDACDYEELPAILIKYDVGLVLYKPTSDNWIYNAPNKVFEYLACGLDVWFSKTMTFTMTFAREDAFPKIIPLDFEKLNAFDFRRTINREGLSIVENSFYYENVYDEIYESLSQ
jgi:hypothetical protein